MTVRARLLPLAPAAVVAVRRRRRIGLPRGLSTGLAASVPLTVTLALRRPLGPAARRLDRAWRRLEP